MAKSDKTSVVIVDENIDQDDSHEIVAPEAKKKPTESPAHKQFFFFF